LVQTNGTTKSLIANPSIEFLENVVPSNNSIMEVISLEEPPWDEFHHLALDSLQTKLATYHLQILSIDRPDIVPSPFITINENGVE